MGLRIQNNVEAFNAHRQLTGTAAKAAKSMEKLSSGYRVTRSDLTGASGVTSAVADVSGGTGTTNWDALDITEIDTAIKNVSSIRGDLGAAQNRLEHRLNNLATYQENLVASESRIRDVDMAAEMVSFTKLGILQQAGTSMLAQANQAPQNVLSLLR